MTQYPGQYGYQPGQFQQPSQPERRGMPVWAKLLIGFLIAGGVLTVLCCAGVVWLGVKAPETFVQSGTQMRRDHVEQINKLGLLEPDERIELFYSDALLDIEKGMYFLTDRKLVLYSNTWDSPARVIAFDEIADVTIDFDDSVFVDSTIWVMFPDENWVTFPVSSDNGGDRTFYEALKRKVESAGGGANGKNDG